MPARQTSGSRCGSVWTRELQENFVYARCVELRLQLDGRAHRRNAAIYHDRDAIAVLRFVHVVRRDEDGRRLCGGIDHFPELSSGDRVDSTRRLVEKYDLRRVQHRDEKREFLLPSKGECSNEFVRPVGKPKSSKEAI